MSSISSLSKQEIEYFTSLPQNMSKTVQICFKNLLDQLDLKSEDAKETLRELSKNYRNWDKTEEGKMAWAPLLNCLDQYIQTNSDHANELVGRIQALQGYTQMKTPSF